MVSKFMIKTFLLATFLGSSISGVFAAAGAKGLEGSKFGFSGPEIFPINNGISQLKSADLDEDGLLDLVLVNNPRSKLTLLYNRTGKTNATTSAALDFKRELNELPPDSRFRIDSIASEKRISSIVVADLNHDKKADIAYYGEPKELVIQYNQGTNGWSSLKRYSIDDGLLDPYALVSGDINGDKRADILLLADGAIYQLTQKEDGTLNEPTKIPYIGSVKSLQILDIQGDGREDLLLVNWDHLNPFRFRLQSEGGKLGPEIHFSLPPIRSYWADDLDKDSKTEMVTIARNSGRAQVSSFSQQDPEDLLGNWKVGQFQMMPLNRTTKPKRGSTWADVDGDGKADLLVSEPDSGQLTLFLQGEDGILEAPKTFATLTGITDLLVTDWEEGKKPSVFLLSSDERQLGITQLDEKNRLNFPSILTLEGRPLAIAGDGLKYKGKPALAVVVDNDGKRELQLRTADGQTFKQKLSESFKSNPSSMVTHDLNQDGLMDLVLLIPYEKIKALLQLKDDNGFQEVDVAPPGGSAELPWMTSADVDGDGKAELLMPQRNFMRAVVLEADKANSTNFAFTVKEQINGAGNNSRIVAATAVKKQGKEAPAIFLFDAERKVISVSDRDESGVWKVVRNIALPNTDFTAMQALNLGSKEQNSVALIGLNTIAWLQLDGKVWQFTPLDGYETPIRDGFLHDVVSGDLNQDERKDLVFLETAKSYVDLVTFEEPNRLVPANRWQVFEERTFRNRRNDLPEPREAIIADLNGDKKNDLVVLVHDRVLLYPQE
ncbi:MAG: FG-GAP repeat domain-containing protein [Verrucomicrobiales bacterium]